MKSVLCLLLIAAFAVNGKGQIANSDPGTQILKIIPASPTAASLGIYGNTPMSYYTGTPNVSVPLFDLSSGSIKLPVSLNHHGGGIKVEEMASWVGLGWSLNAGGVITRTVRGIPDDVANGFFYQPMKVQFMIDHGSEPAYHDQVKTYLGMAGHGAYDTEADIFYFNFGGVAGKFFYDQEQNEFYTIPRTNTKISHTESGDFILTAENGSKYYFTAKEYTNSAASICTPDASVPPANVYSNSISAWYLTKIESVDAVDNITLDYVDNYYSFQTSNSSTGYILTSSIGDFAGQCILELPKMETQHCYQWPTIAGKKLTGIHFKNGYLKFNSLTARCDLNDKALDNVELYNDQQVLKRRFRFQYSYFGDIDQPSDCNNEMAANTRRLKLKSVIEENESGGTILQKKPYVFEYNEAGSFPNRLSFAQDHWGFYNGANTNTSLIPATIYDAPSGTPIWYNGADREVHSPFNQIGALVKINYPTGGTTTFTYESNEVKNNALQPVIIWKTQSIEGDHNGGTQNYYESAPFVVNEPPSSLNGYNPSGGIYMTALLSEIGDCGYELPNAPPTSCAVLNVQSLNNNALSWGPLTTNSSNHYMPNGTYKLTASFQQNPPGYQDFYFQVKWQAIDVTMVNSQLAGGLRIKKIEDYDGIDHAKDIVKNFSYKNEDNDFSSGKINGKPATYTGPYKQLFISTENVGFCTEHWLERNYIKRSSYSNYPLLTSSGSYVGYSNVSVTYGNNGTVNGKTSYTFQNAAQDMIWDFPYPSLSYDWQRGMLNSEKQYKNENNNLLPVSKKDDAYTVTTSAPVNVAHKSINGLKMGYNRDCITASCGECPLSVAAVQTKNEYMMPVAEEYETNTDYMKHISSTTTTYDQADANKAAVITQTFENNDLNYQPSSVTEKNSKGEDIITKIRYSKDYEVNAPYGYFIRNLLEKGMVSVPIERYTILKKANGDQFVVGGTLITYKNNQPVQDKIYRLDITDPVPLNLFTPSYYSNGGAFVYDTHYKEEILFNKYDAGYNLLEQQKKNDVVTSFIWDYNNSLPVAEAVNAAAANIAYTGFESGSTGGWILSGGNIIDNIAVPAGKKCYGGNGVSLMKTGFSPGGYVVSYWSTSNDCTVNGGLYLRSGKTVGQWTYYEHEFIGSSPVIINCSGYIDEVRLHPKTAQMKTYTYDPLVGITSQCDAADNITRYEYDALGRLVRIRNTNNEILKQYDYKYQQ